MYLFISRSKFVFIYLLIFYFCLLLITFITQLRWKMFRYNAVCKMHRYFIKIKMHATRTEYKLSTCEEMCDECLLLDHSP
jgi:hypothetical protein